MDRETQETARVKKSKEWRHGALGYQICHITLSENTLLNPGRSREGPLLILDENIIHI